MCSQGVEVTACCGYIKGWGVVWRREGPHPGAERERCLRPCWRFVVQNPASRVYVAHLTMVWGFHRSVKVEDTICITFSILTNIEECAFIRRSLQSCGEITLGAKAKLSWDQKISLLYGFLMLSFKVRGCRPVLKGQSTILVPFKDYQWTYTCSQVMLTPLTNQPIVWRDELLW